jgi:hypothetical protein
MRRARPLMIRVLHRSFMVEVAIRYRVLRSQKEYTFRMSSMSIGILIKILLQAIENFASNGARAGKKNDSARIEQG